MHYCSLASRSIQKLHLNTEHFSPWTFLRTCISIDNYSRTPLTTLCRSLANSLQPVVTSVVPHTSSVVWVWLDHMCHSRKMWSWLPSKRSISGDSFMAITPQSYLTRSSQVRINFITRAIIRCVQYLCTQYSFPVMPDEKERKLTKLQFLCLVFLTLLKVSVIFSVD